MENIKELKKNIESNNFRIGSLQRGIRKKIKLAAPGQDLDFSHFTTWHNWVYFPSLLVALTSGICLPIVYFVMYENDKEEILPYLLPAFIISLVLCILVRISANSITKKNKKINTEISSLRKLNNEINEKISGLEKGEYNSKLTLRISEVVKDLDADNNGTLDLAESEDSFMGLLKSHQNKILEFEKSEGKDFTNKFVKLSNFLKEKRAHMQNLFSQLKQIKSLEVLDNAENLIKSDMYMYNLLLLDSLHMISSFVEDDRIGFNIIYEKFDKLNVWNTNFQNQMLSKLDLLNDNIEALRGDISEMNHNSNMIIDLLQDLSHISEDNNRILDDQLKSINSSIQSNTVINAINTYQNFRTRRKLS